jgi:hypothetical protein
VGSAAEDGLISFRYCPGAIFWAHFDQALDTYRDFSRRFSGLQGTDLGKSLVVSEESIRNLAKCAGVFAEWVRVQRD